MGETKRPTSKSARTARATQRRQTRRMKQNKAAFLSILAIVLCILVVMSAQIFALYQKNEAAKKEESKKEELLQAEKDRQEAIKAYSVYVTTPEYIEQIAKTKLGLVYTDEIVFKELDEAD